MLCKMRIIKYLQFISMAANHNTCDSNFEDQWLAESHNSLDPRCSRWHSPHIHRAFGRSLRGLFPPNELHWGCCRCLGYQFWSEGSLQHPFELSQILSQV